jgi:hypothetical protein
MGLEQIFQGLKRNLNQVAVLFYHVPKCNDKLKQLLQCNKG